MRTARALAPLAVVATLLCATPAHAQTRLLSRRVGGLGLIGPSIAHPASIHYNPATLGLLPGALRLYLDGTLDFDLAGYEPALVNSQTGVPIAGQRGDTVSNIGLGPRFFFAATSDLANEAVHIAGAIYSPVAQSFSRLAGGDGDFFDGAAQAPGRAHVVELSAYQINFTISASLRVIERWWIGATFTFAYSRMRYAFVRDAALRGGRTREGDEPIAIDDCGSGTPCGYDADAAAEAIVVSGGTTSLGAVFGTLVRVHERLDIGVGFSTRLFDIDGGSGLRVDGDATVRRSTAVYDAASAALGGAVQRDLTGRGIVRYHMPWQINIGATYRATARLTLDLQLRWVEQSDQSILDVQLTGAQFSDEPEIPDRITRFQGHRDVFALQIGAGYKLTSTLTLEGALMLDNGIIPKNATSPLVIDGWSLDGFAVLRWQLTKIFAVQIGYGFVLTLPASVDDSAFAPSLFVDCVEQRFDLDVAACRAALDGRGVTTGAGDYRLFRQRFNVALSLALR
ncbi:MAG: outer membrane protein transport protein [Myxococcales bacterium]|nr:outer membrane protein transport protein [Myxococcales bacterium]